MTTVVPAGMLRLVYTQISDIQDGIQVEISGIGFPDGIDFQELAEALIPTIADIYNTTTNDIEVSHIYRNTDVEIPLA